MGKLNLPLDPEEFVRLMKRRRLEIEHSDIAKNQVVDKDSSRVVDDHVSDVSDGTEDEDVSGVTEDEDEDEDERDKSLERDGYCPFEDCGSDGRKLKLPRRHQHKELLRLMKRGRKTTEIPDGDCCICGDDGHYQHSCPCNQKIPEGVIINDHFDQVCIGCGRIGQNCCSKGVYAEYKECVACGNGGHWFWEGMCKENFVRPPWLVNLLSMKEDA